MEIISICLIGILAALISVMIKRYSPEYSVVISIIAGILILAIAFCRVKGIIDHIQKLLDSTNISLKYISVLFKSLGICFLTQFASDVCKDAGEIALSSKIEIAGKIAILIISLPLFEKITNIAIDLIR